MAWISRTPLPVFDLGFLLFLIVSVEAGYRGYRWMRPKHNREIKGQEFLLTAALGLLALLMGFTFSMSLDRYEARRALVVQEANAIGAAWIGAQLVEEPHRSEISSLLKQYLETRVSWSDVSQSQDLHPTRALQQRLSAAVQRLAHGGASPEAVRWVLDPLNEAFGVQAARTAARDARVPTRVLVVLVLYSILSMVMLGYILAIDGYKHIAATGLLLVLLTVAFGLILDLDRPQASVILVSQQPLLDLRALMR
jgi:hypothetical protein